MKKYPPHVMK
jgi:hypothetical protein